jgi:hypothetical protein
MSEQLKDNLQTPYTTWHGQPAVSGENITIQTPTGPKDGYMLGGYAMEKNK